MLLSEYFMYNIYLLSILRKLTVDTYFIKDFPDICSTSSHIENASGIRSA